MKYIVFNIPQNVRSYIRALYNISNVKDYYALVPYDVHPYLVEILSSVTDNVNFSVIEIGPSDIDEIAYSYNFDVISIERSGSRIHSLKMENRRFLLFDSSKRFPEAASQTLKTSFVGDGANEDILYVSSTVLDVKPAGWNEHDSYDTDTRSSLDKLKRPKDEEYAGIDTACDRNRGTRQTKSFPAFLITSGFIGASWICALSASYISKKHF